mgnify:CR=1 FL=1
MGGARESGLCPLRAASVGVGRRGTLLRRGTPCVPQGGDADGGLSVEGGAEDDTRVGKREES